MKKRIDDVEEKLRMSEQRYRDLLEQVADGIFLLDEKGNFLAANSAICELLGYAREDLLRLNILDIYPAEFLDEGKATFDEIRAGGRMRFERTMKRKDGSAFRVGMSARRLADGTVQGMAHDITERVEHRQAVARLNLVYRVMSKTNQLIVHEKNRQRLLEGVCRIAVEDGGLLMAWVGFVDGRTKTVLPATWFGKEEGYLSEAVISAEDGPLGRGPTGTAIRENRHVFSVDIASEPAMAPWKERALRRGYRSSAAFPLTRKGKAVGAIMAYSGEVGFFDPGVVALLDELAMDISYALESLESEQDRRQADETRAKVETALREAEAALRILVNANPESAVLIDAEGTVLAANDTIARRLGTAPKRMIGERLYDLLPAEVAESRKRYFAESIRTGKPLRFEDVLSGRNEDNYVHPIADERGNMNRLAILGVDVTERKQAEEKLKEQAALLDITKDAILVKDLEDRVLYWNKGAARIYGWGVDETKGKAASNFLFSEKYSSEAREARKDTLEKGEWHGDLHQRTKDGREIVVEGRWTLVLNEHGTPKGILSVDSDVTAQRAIQAQLRRVQRLESLGTLAGGIAHDLNNVLSPILMGVEGLSFNTTDASTRKILEIIKTSAQRGADIVRQILNFARGVEGTYGEVQLKHVLREIEGIVREAFARSIALKSEIPRDLWTVKGDATQLHQVLMNLCVNARDAMPDGGRLTLSASNVQLDQAYAQMNIDARPIRYVVLKVEDTGIGMPPGILEKIFDPFFTTKEAGKGTGLGLSTARSIVKSHGGFINVYSEPGTGSSFKVYLPAAEQGPAVDGESIQEGIPMGGGELILIVEDEISLRDITRQILESYGYRVVTAVDGAEALALYVERKSEIRLVITDMMMPYMDGAATIRALRRIDPKACIIATSGLMVGEYAREAMNLGAQEFLTKPYTAETLLKTLRAVLERSNTV